ncbi:porin [Paraburkholderia caribensis]|uniref:porin n=1 Tax=Paraburkholderia caribensis TaxID=75105 RepID=UPI001CC67660|nr:porin [Paraburkholderia caribensis]
MKIVYAAVGCAASIAASPCYSQSSVTIYGVLDTGVEYVSHVGPGRQNIFRMPGVTASVPTRWGITGKEDIGAGYQVLFTLESGFDTRSGALQQGGRMFGRQAWVGVSTPYGRVSFGRQYTAIYYALLEYDVIGPSINSIGSLDAYVPNARSDNTIAYVFTSNGLTLAGTYSFGRDSAGTGNSPGQGTCAGQNPASFLQCRQWSAIVKYTGDHVGGAVAYDEQRGGPGAAANFFDGQMPMPLTSSTDYDARLLVSAYMRFANVNFSGGWLDRRVKFVNSNPSIVRSDLWYFGASWTLRNDIVLASEFYRIVNSQHDTRASLITARAMYLLSKRSAVYVQVGYMSNSAHAAYSVSTGGGGTTPAPGVNQSGTMIGIRHTF